MKTTRTTTGFRAPELLVTALSLALLIPGMAQAQQEAEKPKTTETATAATNVSTVYVNSDGAAVQLGANDGNGELKKKVSIEADNEPVIDVLKRVLKDAGITAKFDEDVPKDKKITVTMKNVPLSTVLSTLTQEADIGWSYSLKVEGDKKESTIEIGKNRRNGNQTWLRFNTTPRTSRSVTGQAFSTLTPPKPPTAFVTPGFEAKNQLILREAMRSATDAARMAQVYSLQALGTVRLGDTRVKLDVRNSNVRDALKEVLKQADLDYAIEDDVPDNIKRSFTFENVPIATALDVICRSVDVGWSVQRTFETVDTTKRTTEKGTKRKAVILIGKKYARQSMTLNSSVSDMVAPALSMVGDALSEVVPAALFPEPVEVSIPPVPDVDDLIDDTDDV